MELWRKELYSNILSDYEISISHHGISGQKWGVKHGPPYPLGSGKDYTIKKNTKTYRSTIGKEDSKSGHKYVTLSDTDRNFYRKFIGPGESKTYEHVYKTARDLKIAGNDTVRKTIEQVVKENPTYAKTLLTNADKANREYAFKNASGLKDSDIKTAKANHQKYLKYLKDSINTDPTELLKKMSPKEINNLMLGKMYDIGKQRADSYMSQVKKKQLSDSDRLLLSLGGNKAAQAFLFSKLKNAGYDGMLDIAGVGTYRDPQGKAAREGVNPAIIFDYSSLKYQKTKSISARDKDLAYVKYLQQINKIRKKEGGKYGY